MNRFVFVLGLLFLALLNCKHNHNPTLEQPKIEDSLEVWEQLLDKDLSKWQPYLGVPHKDSNVPGYEDIEDLREGKPLGFSNLKNVFSVIEVNDELFLKVTGEIFGSLISKADYENYHLKFEVKWGDKLWKPMQDRLRNNGVLYHSIGEPGGGFFNTWMTSLEFEVENTNYGDFIAINSEGRIKVKSAVTKKDERFFYDFDAPLQDVGRKFGYNRIHKLKDLEKPMGDWTSMELVCFRDLALHIVEGEVVVALYEPKYLDGEMWVPMTKGKLQIQSEGAETYFRNVKIRSLDTLEERFTKYLKKLE